MGAEVTDPDLLRQLNGATPREVTDPALLAQLNGTSVQASAPEQGFSFSEFLKNYGSAAIRPVVKAVSGLPLMAMDAGTSLRNLVTGNIDFSHSILGQDKPGAEPMPSAMFNQALDRYTRAPEGVIGKGSEFISTALLGSRLPAPQAAEQAPEGFINAQQQLKASQVLAAQKEGYVIPPSTTNPTMGNRLLEGLAGKLKVQQGAQEADQSVTNMLAARGLGQNEMAPLTQGAMSAIRGDASAAGYAPVRGFGQMKSDPQFFTELDSLTSAAQGANKSFPGIKPDNSVLDQVVTSLKQPNFDSGHAIDAIQYLRTLADDAYGAGNKSLGAAYKGAAKSVEGLIERNLSDAGDDSSAMLAGFRNARTLMAQTYSVGKALVGDTGDVNARSLTSQTSRGVPLTGPLRTIANFGALAPKVARVPNESFPLISPLDAYGSAMTAAASHSVAPLAYPLTRVGLQQYLLSSAGQARAIPQAFKPQDTLGILGGFPALANQISSFLTQ